MYPSCSGCPGVFLGETLPIGTGSRRHSLARHRAVRLQLWFGCGRRLCVEERGQVTQYGPQEGLPDDAWDAVGITSDGTVWVRSPSKLYRKPRGQARLVREDPILASNAFWGALTLGRDGSVMVPTDKGLAVLREGNWEIVDDYRGLPVAMSSAVLEIATARCG